MAVGLEDRVIPMPLLARASARRCGPRRCRERPRHARRARRGPACSRTVRCGARGAISSKRIMGALHRHDEIPPVRRFGPIGGVDTRARRPMRRSRSRCRRKARAGPWPCRGMRLDPRVFDEGRAGFLGFRQPWSLAEVTEIPKGSKQVRDLLQLALVVGRHQKPVPVKRRMSGDGPGLRSTSASIPLSARSYIWSNSARLKAAPSALACTSISALRPS
jgi:hypothetical protein